MKRLRGSNSWVLLAVTAGAVLVTSLGVHHVWLAQKTLFFRRAVFVELQKNRTLVQQRDILERQVAELRAAPRVAWRARELLGMRPPRPDEMIVVRPEDTAREGKAP